MDNINYEKLVEVIKKINTSTFSMHKTFSDEEKEYVDYAKKIGLLSYNHGIDDLDFFTSNNMGIVLDSFRFGLIHILSKHGVKRKEFDREFDVLEVLLRVTQNKEGVHAIGQRARTIGRDEILEDTLVILGEVPKKFLKNTKSKFLKIIAKGKDVKTQFIETEKKFEVELSDLIDISEEYKDYIYEQLREKDQREYKVTGEGVEFTDTFFEKPEEEISKIQKIDQEKATYIRKKKSAVGKVANLDGFVFRKFKEIKNGTKIDKNDQNKIRETAKCAGVDESWLFMSNKALFFDDKLDYSEVLNSDEDKSETKYENPERDDNFEMSK